MNTTENNKLIAEFMEDALTIPLWTSPSYANDKFWVSEKFQRIEDPDGNNLLSPDEMLFYSDWNWLMPVVEKIESVDNEKITLIFQQKSCLIWDNNRGEELEYFNGSFKSENKMEAVYNACVEFIKWYNEQNPKP